jgi:carbon monoxide dehydrogenase subunit G
VLSDPRAVVDCVPGVKLGDRLEDGSYDATVTVKFGPAKVKLVVNRTQLKIVF